MIANVGAATRRGEGGNSALTLSPYLELLDLSQPGPHLGVDVTLDVMLGGRGRRSIAIDDTTHVGGGPSQMGRGDTIGGPMSPLLLPGSRRGRRNIELTPIAARLEDTQGVGNDLLVLAQRGGVQAEGIMDDEGIGGLGLTTGPMKLMLQLLNVLLQLTGKGHH